MGIPCGTEGSGVASRVRILCQSLLWRAPPGPQPRAVHTGGPSMREEAKADRSFCFMAVASVDPAELGDGGSNVRVGVEGPTG